MSNKLNSGFKKKLISWYGRAVKFVASTKFFYLLLALFVAQSMVFAITLNYPGIYDEEYHYGVIKHYSDNPWPYVNEQPPDTARFGDLVGFTSFLYHIMLVPVYLIAKVVISSETGIVIALRLFNVLIMTLAIIVLRKWLKELKIGTLIVDLTLIAVTTLPFLVLLSATINYESLFILLAMVHMLAFTKIVTNKVSITDLLKDKSVFFYFVSGMLGSITKYSFVPIFVLTFATILVTYIRRGDWKIAKPRASDLISLKSIVVILILTVIGALTVGKYIDNTVRYGSPSPDCGAVHAEEFCKQWAPYRRNLALKSEHDTELPNLGGAISYYATTWHPTMVRNINLIGGTDYSTGSKGQSVGTSFQLAVLIGAAHVILFLAAVGLFTHQNRRMLVIIAPLIIYCGILFTLNYFEYLRLGEPVAIQTRYAFISIPIIFALAAFGISRVIEAMVDQRTEKALLSSAAVIVSLAVMSQYAGAISIIENSPNTWFRDDQIVQQGYDIANKAVKRITIESR